MNNSTKKSIKRLSIAILIIGGLTLIYTYVQMISQLWLNNFITPMTWNPEIKGWQIFILAARFVGLTLLFILCFASFAGRLWSPRSSPLSIVITMLW